MWKSFYDTFLQFLTVSWGEFMSVNHSSGRAVRDNFQNKVYPEIAFYLLIITIIYSIFYYYYLNWRFGRYYKFKNWFFILCLSSITVYIITFLRAKSLLDHPIADVSKHLLWIGVINGFYSAILFLLISLLIKWGSPMGKRTPF